MFLLCLFIFVIFSCWPFVAGQQCPSTASCQYYCGSDDWQFQMNSSASSGIAYQFFVAANSEFWEAKSLCTQNRAVPVAIHNAQQQQFVTNLIASYFPSPRPLTQALWIGLHRINPNRANSQISCRWDDGSQCDYGNQPTPAPANTNVGYPWGTGQPSGTNNVAQCTQTDITSGNCLEYCAYIFSSTGEWNDASCSSPGGGIICQKNCTRPPTQCQQ